MKASTGWIDRASCRGTCAMPSRQTCSRCPVRFDCLLTAFTQHETWQMAGGFNEDERNVFLRRARGDPREALIAAWRSVQPREKAS